LADDSKFDANEDVVGCQNGVLSLIEGHLTETESSVITKRLGTDFDPDAECPIFESFLDTIFNGDEEMISFVQRAVGYSLSGSTREQCLFLMIGESKRQVNIDQRANATVRRLCCGHTYAYADGAEIRRSANK